MGKKSFWVALALMSVCGYADFTLAEDFNSLAPGTINGQRGWTGSSGDDSVVAGQVIVSELLAANIAANGLRDEDGDLSGWIELFNPGPNTVNLTGWSLTDDAGDLSKWLFPPATLAPGRFLVVFASGKDRRPAGGVGRLHTSFSLSPYGEYLALCSPELPRSTAVEFKPGYPEQRNDCSYGLSASGQWRYFATPTPGAANGSSEIVAALGPVHFTTPHGLYKTPFQLVLSPPEPDAAIRYTLDGSQPTEGSGVPYTAPLSIRTTSLVRAAAFRPNSLPSRTTTATYIFPEAVLRQPAAPPGFPVTTLWNQYGWPSEYGVEPSVVNDPRYAASLAKDLPSSPTLSVAMNVEDIFGAANGIYTHAQASGPLWERPCSVELMNPDGSTGFQADAGIQMHGGGSRARTQKHPFRVQFKGKYGPGKLRFQFFPDSPVKEFDAIDLRSEYNNHWTHGFDAAQRARGTMVSDAWCKDVQAAMGGLAGHGRYVHLYINGLYWGVYNPCERLDGSFGAAYLGGDKEDYDAYNGTGTQLVSGTDTAHATMLGISNLQQLSQYDLMKRHLDVTQYADYMLLMFFGANQDWGVSKNWYCLRKREPGAGFKYLCWDDERVMEGVNQLPMGISSAAALNSISPDNLQSKLVASPEYRLLFADRAQKHLFNGGVLTPDRLKATWKSRSSQIDRAIVGESARWGAMTTTDGKPGTSPLGSPPYPNYAVGAPYTRDVNWLGAQDWLFSKYFPARGTVLLGQLRAAGLYPADVMAPSFSLFGGRVPRGYALSMSATNSIYYTTNGADPRVYGSGAIAAGARPYTNGSPLLLGGSTVVKARGLSGASWSALVEAAFFDDDRSSPLRISELMPNPARSSAYEYLELFNTGATPAAVGGFSFEGVNFFFPPGAAIGAGERLVLANDGNPGLWSARYPGVTPAGYYSGSLDNAGERVALLDAFGKTVFSVAYSDGGGWPLPANGLGASLEMIDVNGDANDPANWLASATGTPGQPPAVSPPGTVVLNEVMAWNLAAVIHDGATPDWIELFNAGPNPVDLAGWSLSDGGNPRQFVFPSISLPPGGFLVVWCDEVTNAASGLHAGFALNKDGGGAFLYDASSNRVDAVGFGPQVPDCSIGRIGAGWQLTSPTPGASNTASRTAAATNLVINEWMASSPPGDENWIELYNRSGNLPVALRGVSLATAKELFQVRSLSFVPPHGWLQLAADKKPGPAHLDFKLPAEGGTNSLYDETGSLIDQVAYGPQVEGISQGRLPDGGAAIVDFIFSASPGAGNYIPASTGVALNEICALNRTGLANSSGHAADWLELFNPISTPFSLEGFGLDRGPNLGEAWKFPSDAEVPGHGYLLVWFDNDRPPSIGLEAELNTGHALSSGGDAVRLLDPQGRVVDAVAFGPQAPGSSIGRRDGSWRLLASPTPGAANSPEAALGDAAALRLNEWLAAPSAGQEEFFELYNAATLPIDLGGLFLTDDLSIAGTAKFRISPLSFIGPAGFTKFIADGQLSRGRSHAGFSLGAQGESLRLYSATSVVLDTVVFGPQSAGISEGRLPDGGDAMTFFTCVTPGSSNGISTLRIDLQPRSQTVASGGSVTLLASVSGFGALTCQWFHNGTPAAGATNLNLDLSNVRLTDGGSYQIEVSNACGVIASAVAMVTVVAPPRLGWSEANASGFALAFTGQKGLVYAIEKSTNLVQWSVLETVTAMGDTVTLRDPDAAHSNATFYRARWVP